MRATAFNYCNHPSLTFSSTPSSRQFCFPNQPPCLGFISFKGQELYIGKRIHSTFGAINGGNRATTMSILSSSSPWNDKPYELLPSGKRAYLDEQDVVTFLDPSKDLIPLDPTSYNPAAYLWKKIKDIPEERRYRLLHLLKPGLISRAWEIAGTRYEDLNIAKKSSSSILPDGDGVTLLEFWNCRTSEGPTPIAWMEFFKKAIFRCKDGKTYGRLIGGSVTSGFANSFCPLYFMVGKVNEVMSTEQPCDFAYEFGDGLLDLQDYPQGFPTPVKHPWPFSDQVVIYVRHVGPGVLVGQAWQEGEALEKVPQKLCGEILMVKDYAALVEKSVEETF
ncbi:uncharacterized protein LOC132284940 [Cornus florida]|uniref:uncharacterized protein LOC132284940 n=1 Tax=Cornus florida TaxID=4283 RepID=UPI00289EAAEF|nr:uncharacterized protein LOC132284940 [Cornus florida]